MGLLLVIAIYIKQLLRSQSTPNPATWLIWVVVCSMNTVSYWYVVDGDMGKWLITCVSTIGLFSIFCLAWYQGKFTALNSLDWFTAMLVLIIGYFWQTTGDAVIANLLLQGIFLISFWPTLDGLYSGKAKEAKLAWDVAVSCYVLMCFGIFVSWNENSWYELAHPILNGIVGNGSVALMIRYKARTRPRGITMG